MRQPQCRNNPFLHHKLIFKINKILVYNQWSKFLQLLLTWMIYRNFYNKHNMLWSKNSRIRSNTSNNNNKINITSNKTIIIDSKSLQKRKIYYKSIYSKYLIPVVVVLTRNSAYKVPIRHLMIYNSK
jgi:hypothetical protein